ncbi:T9SS type A sorting domain-containing protein [Aquimarina sp. MMG016]|uniref:T9SS type A sorting domain-containing protein n=1 Tax=Aquimarina sp. MMG016 TaxID=2822690 RepID=UPI001B39EC7F|nr:T9SS type A sorting domain-containing protein [Aquimarina sp. MMG016]MBQ4819287.1 T9SS type A sorting domain-containing protein [Aquimarina sp. MMG016]
MSFRKTTRLKLFLFAVLCAFLVQDGIAQQLQTSTSAAQDLKAYAKHYNQKNVNKRATRRSSNTLVWPGGVNPFNSYNADKGSYKEWNNYFYKEAQAVIKNRPTNKNLRSNVITEIEGDNESSNDTQATAQSISNFGSGADQINRVTIQGGLTQLTPPEFTIDSITPTEDNGSIPLANFLTFDDKFTTITGSTAIGDGPHGSSGTATGDNDFYGVTLKASELVEFRAFATDSSLVNPLVVLFNEQGQIIDFDAAPTPTTFLRFIAPVDGNYFFGLYDFETVIVVNGGLVDPLNSGTGAGVGVEGNYDFAVSFYGETETDFYSFQLEKGDVFGVAVAALSNSTARLFFPNGQQAVGTSAFGNRFIEGSPLPLNGQTTFSYIAPENGTYTISISGNFGPYSADIVSSRPGLEINKGQKQYIYLDFTGADFKQRDFFNVPDSVAVGDPELDKERFLSPFGDFLENWGIRDTRGNRLRLAFEATRVVRENLEKDFIESGLNPNFDVEIISDYGSDLLGERIPDFLERAGIPYGKMIIGGTVEESGIQTIGIANAIDPGNYSLTDEAIFLMDIISSDNPNSAVSLNNVPLADGVSIEDLIVEVVGNITSHEIGHYLGNFHTSVQNNVFSIMDEGGPIISQAGVFPGGAFGDANTVNMEYARDIYSLREFFEVEGIDLTDVNTAFALSSVSADRQKSEFSQDLKALEDMVLAELYQKIPVAAYSYPNPQSISETSELVFSTTIRGNATVILYDLQGRKVQTLFNGLMNDGESKVITLDPAKYNLKSGIYMYSIKTPEGETNHKIAIR